MSGEREVLGGPTRRCSALLLAGLLLAPLVPTVASAQEGAGEWEQEGYPTEPPPPLEATDVRFPAVARDTLENGLQVVVVENHEQPVVSIRLYVPAGEVAEGDLPAGVANLTTDVLDKGAGSLSGEEIARRVEGAGASLGLSASNDFAFAATTTLTDRLDTVLEVFTTVVREPTFPEEAFERAKERFLSNLRAELSQPAALASRRFNRVVYGDHPYGEEPTPETVAEITRDQLREFHARHWVPEGSLLVLAGDVEPAEGHEIARRWFGEWRGERPPAPETSAPPERTDREVHLVHRPGSVQSNIRVGHLGIEPSNEDRYALDVMNKVLGGGANARLFLILREEKGWTYGAYSGFSEPQGLGSFSARAEVRNPVTDSALLEILDQMERIREEPVSETELEEAKSFLTGSFPLRIETPSQVASQVADAILRGLGIEYLETYRSRISEVGREEVRAAAREYLHPDRAAVVVVGDGRQVHDAVREIGPVTLYDPEGNELALSDLEVRRSDVALDARRLKRGTHEYSVSFQGNPVGSYTITVEETAEGNLRVTETIGGIGNQTTRYVTTPSLRPISVSVEGRMGPVARSVALAYEDGRVTGSATVPQGGAGGQGGGMPQMEEVAVDTTLAEGVLDQNMTSSVVLASPLEPGASFDFPTYEPGSGTTQLSVEVVGERTVEVPAGSFETYELELSLGAQTLTLFVTKEEPRLLVKQELAGQPVTFELTASGTGEGEEGQAARGGGGG